MGFFDEFLNGSKATTTTKSEAPKEAPKKAEAPKEQPKAQAKPKAEEPKEPTAYDKVREKVLEERSMDPSQTTNIMLIAFGNEFLRECERDKDLAEAFLKKGKTMKEVYDFALDWARDKVQGGQLLFMDTELFQQCWQQFLDYVPKPKQEPKAEAKKQTKPSKAKPSKAKDEDDEDDDEEEEKPAPKKTASKPKAEKKEDKPKKKYEQGSIFADWFKS